MINARSWWHHLKKALSHPDCFILPKLRPRFVKSLRLFLEEDLRLDMEQFYKMDVEILERVCRKWQRKNEI